MTVKPTLHFIDDRPDKLPSPICGAEDWGFDFISDARSNFEREYKRWKSGEELEWEVCETCMEKLIATRGDGMARSVGII